MNEKIDAKQLEYMLGKIPMKRLGTIEEVAAVVSKDVLAKTIAGGVPVKIIKNRVSINNLRNEKDNYTISFFIVILNIVYFKF